MNESPKISCASTSELVDFVYDDSTSPLCPSRHIRTLLSLFSRFCRFLKNLPVDSRQSTVDRRPSTISPAVFQPCDNRALSAFEGDGEMCNALKYNFKI